MMHKLLTRFSKNRPGLELRKILSNISWLVAEKIIRILFSLVVGIWIIRYLGPEQYGIYSYAIAIVGMLAPLSSMGLPSIAVRNLVQEPDRQNTIIGSSLAIELVGGLIVIPLSVLLGFILRPDDHLIIIFIGIVSVSELLRSFEVISFLFRAKVQAKYIAISNIFAFSISNALKVIFLSLNLGLPFFILIYPTEFAFISLFLIGAYILKVGSPTAWKFDRKYALSMLSESWPLVFSGFVIMIYMRSDQIMIAQILDDQAAGIYSAAVKLSEMWYFIPIAIVDSVSPSIVKARQFGIQKYYDRLSYLSSCVVILSYGAAIVTTIVSPFVIDVLYGSAYSSASSILSLHVWSGCFVVLGLVRSVYTTTESATHIPLIATGMGALVNVVLNYFLISAIGIVGAAVATIAAQAIASFISSLLFSKTRQLFLIQLRSLFLLNIKQIFEV